MVTTNVFSSRNYVAMMVNQFEEALMMRGLLHGYAIGFATSHSVL